MLKEIKPTHVWTHAELFSIAGLMLLGLALRLPGLNQGLWFDEIVTLVNFVRLPAEDIVNQYYSLNNHVFYSLSAHVTTQLFGESAVSLRLPALVFSICTIPAIYHLGRQITSRQEALLATVFLVGSYHHVWFSQNARGYTGLILGAVLASILFLHLIKSANPRVMVIPVYAIVVALTTWIHLTAISMLMAHGLIWLTLMLQRSHRDQAAVMVRTGTAILLAAVLIVVIYSPLLPGLIQHFASPAVDVPTSWKSTGWVLNEFIQGINQTVPGGWPVLVVVMAVMTAGVVSYLKQGVTLLAVLLLPVSFILIAIFATNQILYPRFLISAMPFLLLIGVRGGFVLSSIILPFLSGRQVLIAGLLVAVASFSQVPAAWKPKQDFESTVQFLNDQREPGDEISCLTFTYLPLAKYWQLDCKKIESPAQLDSTEEAAKRSWIIYTLPVPTSEKLPEVWSRIQSEYQQVRKFKGSLHGGDITVMLRKTDSNAPVNE